MKSGRVRAVSILFAGTTTLVAGCGGGSHFKNESRPPVPVQLTGVVTDRAVQVSPRKVGAGPVVITVSNQTTAPHTLTLEGPAGGGGTTDTVGPVNPMGTGKLQQTLKPGSYTLKAGSQQATVQQIAPGRVTVTRQRQSSSNDLLLP
jgi:hypothetical protein